ncbi:TetR/AcrR family transcriptional regulator [Pseudoduganella albidiflava]|uniref:TetR family transcriptional regulator n=1 Tax=Pseudoduganella albidiflava TaxID=321983 RepID=A0A411X0X8_9BURK|nr:TetR/AcrR family transcriptional regulator [Pseudoduganella albidiflava]QBI02623.1 TetR/AcrR family transcriptional regulator [Pseudoduganella albidiflava]GGY41229.1 TetR family transcriptional regulator [Pseudoduganella albidiflava]
MARPKSEEKRLQLLHAAAEAVAQRGVGAPTAMISAMAGVAEGTLFRYFPTKEALLNELYLHLFGHMCAALAEALDPAQPLVQRARQQWNAYIDWGLAHPSWIRAINQLAVTDILTPQTRAAELSLFPDLGLVEATSMNSGLFQDLHPAFDDAIIIAIADATLDFATREPARAAEYKLSGFNAYARIFLPSS